MPEDKPYQRACGLLGLTMKPSTFINKHRSPVNCSKIFREQTKEITINMAATLSPATAAPAASHEPPPLVTGPWAPTAQRLLCATIELLDKGGETAVKVKPLTDDLGINVTAIYRYFGDRQGLVNAAQAERYMSGISQDVQTLASALEKATSATNFRKRFNTIAVDILSPQRMPNLMRRANIIGSAHGRPELLALIGEATRTANDDVVDLLRSAQQRGWVLPKADLEVVVSWIVSVFFGRLLVWIDPRPPADQEAWIMMVLEPLNQALFGRKAPRLATLHAQRP